MESILRPALAATGRRNMVPRFRPACRCLLHNSSSRTATPLAHPIAPGAPPQPPRAPATEAEDRVARKKKQAELLERGQKLRTDPAKPGSALKKRFWKDVSVQETADGYQVLLDKRPVRTAYREVLTLPPAKHALATAIALEWDLLVSAQQALKHHYIPLTSMTSRAQDIQTADAQGKDDIRKSIVKVLMRYLQTDTLLCWAPEKNIHDSSNTTTGPDGKTKQSLRSKQMEVAEPIIAYLRAHVFPGVDMNPVLGEETIMPIPQPQVTQEVIRAWIHGLPAFELAGLERGVLASKSLLVAVRLLVEWSHEFRDIQKKMEGKPRFGITEAAEACSVEVKWQTDMWGEVEDTHDVEREDLARQLGSVILLVS